MSIPCTKSQSNLQQTYMLHEKAKEEIQINDAKNKIKHITDHLHCWPCYANKQGASSMVNMLWM